MSIRMDATQRRSRLAVRHHLAPGHRSGDVAAVAGDLVGLHSSDATSVFLAARARMPTATVGDIERDLYDTRTVVRMLGMRRTVFVVPVELVPIVQTAATRAIAVRERRRLVQMLEDAGIARDGTKWLRRVEEATVWALAARGEATAVELTKDVPELREQILFGEGKKWQGRQGVSTRVLFVLAAEGRIVRGRPLGSWTSSQYRWAPMDRWLPARLSEPSVEAAQADLAQRWLQAFGPAPAADLKWWTGWTAAEVKRALDSVSPVEVDLDGVGGLVLSGDLVSVGAPDPWVALLPALDPTVMAWSQRGWFLGSHGPVLFDRSGNAGPTVWCDGRVVGGWAQRKDGEIVVRLLEDVGADARAAVDAESGRLATWLGPLRFTPRFRTPLERELAG